MSRFGAGQNVGPRTAPSLGGNDPRARRAPEATKNEQLVLAPPLYFDTKGRLAIRLGPGLTVVNGEVRIASTTAAPTLDEVDGGTP